MKRRFLRCLMKNWKKVSVYVDLIYNRILVWITFCTCKGSIFYRLWLKKYMDECEDVRRDGNKVFMVFDIEKFKKFLRDLCIEVMVKDYDSGIKLL